MPSQSISLSPTELAYLSSCLTHSPPLRPDGRSPSTFRALTAEIDLLPFNNGSARVTFADGAEGIVGVKAELEKTLPAQRSEGDGSWVEISIDSNLAEEDGGLLTFAQMIHHSLTTASTHQLPAQLAINRRWHWRLYIDILLISAPPGSLPLPLLSISTHLALRATRLPARVTQDRNREEEAEEEEEEDPLFNDDWASSTPLYPAPPSKQHPSSSSSSGQPPPPPPITLLLAGYTKSTTTETGRGNILFDPSQSEILVADALLAITLSSASTDTKIKILEMRTLSAPAQKTTASVASVAGEEPLAFIASTGLGLALAQDGGDEGGVWAPPRGGVHWRLLARMIDMCTRPGGVGEEVLKGLDMYYETASAGLGWL